jgi:hypothetical protein
MTLYILFVLVSVLAAFFGGVLFEKYLKNKKVGFLEALITNYLKGKINNE